MALRGWASRNIPRSSSWVVLDLPERKIVGPRTNVNHATANITHCALSAIITDDPLKMPHRFLALAGSTSYAGTRLPWEAEEAIVQDIKAMLAKMQEPSAAKVEQAFLRQHYQLQARLFDDPTAAAKWARGEAVRKSPPRQQS